MDYDTRDIVSIDMKLATQLPSRKKAKPFYFMRFRHLTFRKARVVSNSLLSKDIGTGFAEVQEWEFADNYQPVIPAWFGKHFVAQGWTPIPLLAFVTLFGLLTALKVREAIVAFEKQT